MKNIFVILGESGSGKSTLAKGICTTHNNIKLLVTCTSRPKRKNEVNQKDYFFLTDEEFDEMIKLKMFIEHTTFRNWHYGLKEEQIINSKFNNMLVVLNPQGFETLLNTLDKQEYKVIPFYIFTHERIRLIRSLNRNNDVDEIIRRINADRFDFKDIPRKVLENNGYILKNNDSLDSIVEEFSDIVDNILKE